MALPIITKAELIKLTAIESGFPQTITGEVLSAYESVIRKSLLKGFRVKLNHIGTIGNTEVPPRAERITWNPQTQQKQLSPARPAYNRPIFKANKGLAHDMRERTLGNIY